MGKGKNKKTRGHPPAELAPDPILEGKLKEIEQLSETQINDKVVAMLVCVLRVYMCERFVSVSCFHMCLCLHVFMYVLCVWIHI